LILSVIITIRHITNLYFVYVSMYIWEYIVRIYTLKPHKNFTDNSGFKMSKMNYKQTNKWTGRCVHKAYSIFHGCRKGSKVTQFILTLIFLLVFKGSLINSLVFWHRKKLSYNHIFLWHSKNKISSFITLFSSAFSMSQQHCKFKKSWLPYLESICGFPGLVIFSYHCKL
jgi:hypothetical protein